MSFPQITWGDGLGIKIKTPARGAGMTPDQIRSMEAGPELAHAVKMMLRSYDAYQEAWEVNGEMQAKQQAAFDAWRSKVEALLAVMEDDNA